jgi:hypothetical protein
MKEERMYFVRIVNIGRVVVGAGGTSTWKERV